MNSDEEVSERDHEVTSLYKTYVTTHTGGNPNEYRGLIYYAAAEFIPTNKNLKILDLGCGDGNFLSQLRQQGYGNVWGVDLSPEQISLARMRGFSTVEHLDAISYLNRHSAHFDVITANDFLEHLSKREVLEILPPILQALRPGGVLIAQTLNGAGPLFGRYFYGDFTHGTAFSAGSIHQICKNAGFTEVCVFAVTPKIHGIRSLARALVWRLASAMFKIVIASEQGQLKGHIVTSNLVFTAKRDKKLKPGSASK